jgi:hypothetical protein
MKGMIQKNDTGSAMRQKHKTKIWNLSIGLSSSLPETGSFDPSRSVCCGSKSAGEELVSNGVVSVYTDVVPFPGSFCGETPFLTDCDIASEIFNERNKRATVRVICSWKDLW